MERSLTVLAVVVAVLCGAATYAGATPVSLDGIWHEFSFIDADIPAMGCYPNDPDALDCTGSSSGNSVFGYPAPWQFTATSWGARLAVTDAFLYGDVFEVFDNGRSIGRTPLVAAGGGCGDDPLVCVSDPLDSHRFFSLGAGDHSIAIVPVVVQGPGAAYFALTEAPEPATWVLLLTGFGVLGLQRRLHTGRRTVARRR